MSGMRPVFEEFEPRILYSADLAPLVLAGLADQQIDAQAAAAQGALQHEIAFVDLSLPDAQALIDDLNAQARAGRAIEVVTIGAGVDGIELISSTLAGRDDIAALHLLSHGGEGVVQLGSSRLDATTLLARAGEVAAWRAALTDDADLLIYGCDVAAQPGGLALINDLAALTGADVAASDDPTGAANRGGDWVLEVASGSIQARAAIATATQQSWGGLMLLSTNELPVNLSTPGSQQTSAENRGSQQAVALDAAGNYVVVWTSQNQDGSGFGVYARRFDASGAALTGEVLVNTTTADNQRSARVVSDSAGNFVVTWTSSNQDGTVDSVYFRRFDAGGGPMTGEIRANTTTTGVQADSVISMNASNGEFVIVWQGEGPGDTAGIFFRRFNADGSAKDASDRLANLTDGGTENDPTVAMDSTGKFVVFWEQGKHIYFQRFDAAGAVLGGRVQVDNGLSTSSGPAVACDAAGNFTVVYREENTLTGVWGKGFNADGTLRYNWFRSATADATSPSIDMASDGSFVLVYEASADGDGVGVFGHKYNADGSSASSAFQINQITAGNQSNVSVAAIDINNYVAVWSGKSAGDSSGVVARQFSASNTAPVITSNSGGNYASISRAENTTAVTTVTATDADAGATLSYSIVGGVDAALFSINPGTGALTFIAAPNFEAPADVGADNIHDVVVQVSDGTLVDIQTLTVTVTNANEAPTITSDGGGASASVSVAENTAAVTTVTATDPDAASTRTYSLVAGGDAALFSINASTGVLRFATAPNFEAPTDAGANNVYNLTVQVSDGSLTDTQALVVTVTDVNEVLTVTTVADSVDGDVSSVAALLANAGADGAISLREALLAANASAGADQINFAIAGSGVHTINVLSLLPVITDTVTLDGRSQTGFAGTPLIEINGVAAGASADGLVLGAGSSNSVVRGLVVNRFDHSNIVITGGSAGNLLAGNYVGTAASGLAASGTSFWGIDVNSAGSGNVIGGTGVGDANVIGGLTGGGGIALNNTLSSTVIGNFIGVASDGNTALGNGDGILVINNTAGTRIGGVNTGEGNLIAYSVGDGIDIGSTSSASVLGNRFFLNGGMAIDLGADNAVQANDALDADGGANALQNFPVLTLAEINGTDLHIVGTLDSAAASYYRVEFFADTAGEANGHGEGRSFLGFATVSTNALGQGTFDLHLTASVSAGQVVSATATASNTLFTLFDGTSEFGANRSVASLNTAPVITSNGAAASAAISVAENTAAAITTVTASDADLPAQTLSYAIAGGADAALFSINTLTGELRFTAAPNFEAPADAGTNNVYDVSVQVSDGTAVDTQALSITVTNVNEAPVAVADAYSTTQNTALTVPATSGLLVNDADPEGQTLSVVSVTQPTHGTVSLTPGMVTAITNLSQNAAVDTRGGWSPDGSKIVFDSNRNGNNEIYVMNADGTGAVRLTNNTADDSQGAWSPDGSKIAFMSNRSGAYEVWVMNSDGTGLLQLTSTGSATSGQPAWSPDGSKIAFTSDRSGGNFEIWVMNANGTGLARLTSASGEDTEPAWSPDGTKIVFSSGRDGNNEIYVMNADGSGQTRLTTAAGLDRAPDWSPDGSKIAFISDRSGTAQVWVMDVSGAHPTAVTAAPSAVSFVLWSPDGAKLLFTLNNEIQSAAIANTGGFVYTPNAGYAGADSFSYTATDASGLTSTATVTLTVTAVGNTAPVITSNGGGATAAISVAENGSTVTTVTATDADLPAQTLTYTISGGADAALFSINGTTGALAFIAASNFEAPTDSGANNVYNLTVQVSDGALADTQALAITVTNVNEAPVITSNGAGANASLSVAENQTVAASQSATDVDAATSLTWSIVGGADAALFNINATTGALSFASAPNFEAPADAGANNVYNVTVRVSDGVLADTQALEVSLTNVNEAPVITSNGAGANASLSVAENQTLAASQSATDVDAATSLAWSIVGGADAALFNINAATGVLSFATTPNFEAPADAGTNNVYEVSVRVSDGALADTQALAISVTNVNEAPVITSNGGAASAAISVAEFQTAVSTVTATDVDAASSLTYSISGGADAALFSIDAATGALRFIAAPSFATSADAGANGIYDVTVRVSDGALADIQALAVTVTNVNDAPVITSGGGAATASYGVTEMQTAVATVTATDPDAASTLTYSIAGGADAALFSINSSSGALRFITAPDFEAPTDAGGNNIYDLVVQVSDGALSDTQAIAVSVLNQNEAPVITANSLVIAEGGSAAPLIAASDVDSAPGALVYSVGNLTGGRFELTSAPGVAITSFTQADVNAGLLRFVHDGGQAAPAYALTLSDGALGTAAQAASISFTPVNDAPVAGSPDLGVIAEDGSRSFSAADLLAGSADADGDVLSVANLTLTAGQGSLVDHGNGSWTFTPDADWSGSVTLGFDISDGTASVAGSALLRVSAVNDAPTVTSLGGAASASVAIDENSSAVMTVTGRDIDGPGALTYSLGGGADAAAFAIDPNTGALRFITAPDREQPTDANADNRYDVIVRVSDGALFAQQALAVTVNNLDEAPTLVTNTLVLHDVAAGGGNSLVLLATDPDTPASALLFQTSGVVGGQFEMVGAAGVPIATFTQADVNAGSVLFVPDGTGTTPQYVLQVSDGTTTSTTTPVTLVIAAGPPTGVADAESVPAPEPVLLVAPPAPAATSTATEDFATTPRQPQTAAGTTAVVVRDGPAAAQGVVNELAGPSFDIVSQGFSKAAAATTTEIPLRHDAPAVEAVTLAMTQEALPASDLGNSIAIDLNNGSGSASLDLASALRERSLVQALEPLRREASAVQGDGQQIVIAGSAASAGLSVGYVLWLARGGVLMASVLSALPAWASLDPLPVLGQVKDKTKGTSTAAAADDEDDEGDAVEQLFDKTPAASVHATAHPNAYPPAHLSRDPARGAAA